MKRIGLILLAALLALSAALPVSAAEKTPEEMDGKTFSDLEFCAVSRPYTAAPVTFEAWVYVPKSDDTRQGVVVGNYSGTKTASVNFEITSKGRPRIYVVKPGSDPIDITFYNADVRTGDWAHVAVVYDAANGVASCYINGTLRETSQKAATYDEAVVETAFVLGGDHRSGNVQYFKSALRSVTMYSDLRTADEIRAAAEGKRISYTDPDLVAHYDMKGGDIDGVIYDDSSAMNDVQCIRTWIDEKAPITDYAYSFCIVGDTQKIAINTPEKLHYIYDWIVANKDEKKISYVFGLGDITDKSTDAEWEVAKAEIEKLNGVVQYSLTRGNHDGSSAYNAAFGTETYKNMFKEFYDANKIETSWTVFTAGDVDYLHITLDYGPTDAELAWAANIIEQNPDHRVIISTHAYLYRDGTTLDENDEYPPRTPESNNGKNNGDEIWDKLVRKYENIFLVLSGHDPCSNVIVTQTEGDHGNVVTQMLVDPQGVDNAEKSVGLVAMLYFSIDGKTVSIEYYSTIREQFYMTTSQMDITVPRYEKATPAPVVPDDEPIEDVVPDEEIEETDPIESEPSETDDDNADDKAPAVAITTALIGAFLCLGSAFMLQSKKRREEKENKK